MPFYRTNDPVRDAERYATEMDREMERLPTCDVCGEPQDDTIYMIDGELLCRACVDAHYMRRVLEGEFL